MKNILNKPLILLIRFYQISLSPFFGPNCRHLPTCSQYSIEAFQEWGMVYGFWLSIKRISRCNPWGTDGYDPVPNNKNKAKSDE